jgi:excisionase family DNA binding protein
MRAAMRTSTSPTTISYSPDAFGKRHGFGRGKVYAMLHRGEIAGVKVGKHTRILAAEEERWLASLPRY